MSIETSRGNGKYTPPPRGGVDRCGLRGCDGEIVRHSLGCGMAVGRCSRCFARYELRRGVGAEKRSNLQRLLHEIVAWREED